MLRTLSGGASSIEEHKDYVFEEDVRLPLELEEVLGQGASAIVEKVRDTTTGRVFALKKFTFARTRARAQKEEPFKCEVAITRRLADHLHIIRVHATFVARLSFGLILEPVANEGNLEEYLGAYWDAIEEPQLSNTNVKAMTSVLERAFGCLANGLAFMHSKDIRHKDIKPQNILVHRGMVIYTDFGSAKDGKQTGSNTTEGPTQLTRRYAPPEVLDCDPRNSTADVYCLGCVFVELLAAVSQTPIFDPDKGFSYIMDEVHEELASIKLTSRLSFLPPLIIGMTVRDRTQRPGAGDVFASMPGDEGFFCSGCSLGPTPSSPLWSQGRWPRRILRGSERHGTSERLKPSFQIQYPGYNFYKRGVVFRVLWPELAGDVKQDITIATTSTGTSFGEKVYYKIRWFVVIREGNNFCTCLSIQTYGGKGVPENKPNDHHAIMYTGESPPRATASELAPTEPPMGRPIRVMSKAPWNTMDPRSRVNFLKPYTVEHNVKVEEFGHVDPNDEWNLMAQFKSHWGIEDAEPLPPA